MLKRLTKAYIRRDSRLVIPRLPKPPEFPVRPKRAHFADDLAGKSCYSEARAYHDKSVREYQAACKRAGVLIIKLTFHPGDGSRRVFELPASCCNALDERTGISTTTPVYLCQGSDTHYWWYDNKGYATKEVLKPEDVKALVLEDENRKRLKLEKAHALMAMREQLDNHGKRQPIPQEIKQAVWIRDKGRCVQCGSNKALEFDHIIPLVMGGANSDRNLQLLCEMCNRRKGPTLG